MDAEVAFAKKAVRNKNMRKRATEEEADEAAEEGTKSEVVRAGKAAKRGDGRLDFSSGTTQRRQRQAEEEEEAEERGADKRAAGNFVYESSKVVQTETDQRATATLETETAFDRDARAMREKILRRADEALQGGKGGGEQGKKVYRGMNGYVDHKAGFRRENTISGEKAGGAHGPLRASAHIRWSVRFDYQPDICKDYKETGYCGYGDSCKFLHDRGDYKSGWQMEKDWDEDQKRKKERAVKGLADEDGPAVDSDEEDDELPFACLICREPFREPVATQCKHYFCEHCALKHHARNKFCFVCNKPTNGVFNTAHEIVKKMKESAAAAAAAAAPPVEGDS